MDLITPSIGLLFWTALVFCILLFILAKFIWKPILKAVNEREQKIADSLELAEKTKAEMQSLQLQNENLLKEARAERDKIVKDAHQIASKMVDDAKSVAKSESAKIIATAHQAIEMEKTAAMQELKDQVAVLSIQIAEKIIRQELSSDEKQKTLASKLAEDINLN
ncbi:MAG: F0F1 ATP synthase subunit B [Flavobacteriia bacterium]|nr:F0F1 ATP synthase subunit B [Flavobacteriia bacterium]